MAIHRTFQNIPDGKLSESDHQSYLVNLGWSSGIGWEELLRSKRVLIVSEAGAGKTHECREQQKQLFGAGEAAFYLELARLASVPDLRILLGFNEDGVDEEARFDAWLGSQSEIATFFLDSVDELKLTLGRFEEALKRLRKGIKGQLDRAQIIITTRPIPFDEQLIRRLLPLPQQPEFEVNADSFAKIAMGRHSIERASAENEKVQDWQTVALMPLSDSQIEEFSRDQGVDDSANLLADLKRRNAEEFARRPQDLIELCADWRDFKRIRTHREQVATNIHIKLKPRQDRLEPADLSVEKAIDGASRLALAMMVTRRLTIRHNAEADLGGEDAALDPAQILHDWTVLEHKALLERPLFGFASYGRVRFHHRSVAEYLAAERIRTLRKQGMPVRALKRLIFADTDGKTVTRPSKRAMTGWLALCEPSIFEILRDHEPAVLLTEGDPESLSSIQRNQALSSYVERYGKGGWRGLSVPSIQVHRFATSELAPEINRHWARKIENHEVREVLLSLIEKGRIVECSDIAYEALLDRNAAVHERLTAIEGLAALNDPRLDSITAGIAENPVLWPDKLARGVILRLFPANLTVSRLCELLNRIGERRGMVGDLSWHLPDLISAAEWEAKHLDELRDGLLALISEGLECYNDWSPLASNRAHLSNALAATCLLGLKTCRNYEWLHASALAIRLTESTDRTHLAFMQLKAELANLSPEENAMLFWAEDALLQKLNPTSDPWNRCRRILMEGATRINLERDGDWIKAVLTDKSKNADDRAMLLEIALRIAPSDEKRRDHLVELSIIVAGYSDLAARVDLFLRPPPQDEEKPDWQVQVEKREEEQKKKEAENHASWVRFWTEVVEQPDTVFSDERSGDTAWSLWRAMRNSRGNDRPSDWNRRLIETHFGKVTADRLRLTMMKIWRNDRPTLRSERPDNEKNTYFLRWELGLAAIYAEAEDSDWAVKLSEEEARLAARYVPMELNRFPSWIESLVISHPEAVDATLGNELTLELEETAKDQWHSMILQNISYSADTVVAAFLPRLRAWLDSNFSRLCACEEGGGESHRLKQIVDVLIKHGDDGIKKVLLTQAKQSLESEEAPRFVGIWLPVLLRLDAVSGVNALEDLVRSIEPAKQSKAVTLFARLFDDRDGGINLSDPQFTPAILLRLMRLSYRHVRPSDDTWHEGCFTPDERDDAESARGQIVNVLLKARGEDGWAAKLEMSADPLCSHFKDRIIAMAEEQRAEEIDAVAFDDCQALALDRTGEAPPSSNESMFALMVNRLEDVDDLLLRDVSPREAWAGITSERVMRREIARELSHHANGLYKIDQEAVTADEKETDIRMRSTASSHEAVIELKLADKNRTARELREAISVQLVTKYMAAENSRSGCLLLTLAEDRQWDHPDNGSSIGFSDLVALLSDEATNIEKRMGGNLRLHIHALDLRPRLATETIRKKRTSVLKSRNPTK